jgi:acyl-coenzyme A thioesterase PaaI-like protein
VQVDKKTVKTNKGLKEYTCLGCPLTRNHTAWCFRLCSPDEQGHGRCGRVAPHSLKGKTQLSIERHDKRLLDAHCEELERRYLAAPINQHFDSGVRISEGEAEILIPPQERFSDLTGTVHASVCFTAMADSAALAVNSIVEKALIAVVRFDIQLTRPSAAGAIIARSRFVGMSGNHYLAESVLTDSDGREIGKGSGEFVESDVSLSSDGENG